MNFTRQFFNGCFSETEIKVRYRDLCRTYHPDVAGHESTRIMQDINAEYLEALKGEYRKSKSEEDAQSAVEADERACAVLAKIIMLPDITIEIVGRWIWVTGFTFAVKDQLKAAGLCWASKKRAWHWHAPEDACRGGRKSLDEIKAKYGAREISGSRQQALAA